MPYSIDFMRRTTSIPLVNDFILAAYLSLRVMINQPYTQVIYFIGVEIITL